MAPVNSFAAIGDNGTVIPPDTEGAVGPHHLMEALNSQVVIQDRSGKILSAITNWTFWAALGVTQSFDAHILYDPYAQRWIFSSAAGENSSTAAVLIGVSQTNDPTAGWNIYKVNLGSSVNWVDYPTLGFNKNWIVVQANIFTIAGNSFVNSKIWAFDKADLYAGGTGKYTALTPTSGFTQVPATTMDPDLSTMYLLEHEQLGLRQASGRHHNRRCRLRGTDQRCGFSDRADSLADFLARRQFRSATRLQREYRD